MGEKLVVGPINKGLVNNREPFYIDNDSFPVLINAYQWRGRVKRKRGTSLLNRLRRYFDSTSTAYIAAASSTITLDGSGNGNLITGFGLDTRSPNASIFPTSVTITAPGPTVYTDPSGDGTLSPSGSINYATGAITIAAEAGNAVSVQMNYYPGDPVLGLRSLENSASQFPGNLAFDTSFAYNIVSSSPYSIYDVSFYKNPTTGTYSGYTQKTTPTKTRWNGENYQQFWSRNYQGAFWVTNGIQEPFTASQFTLQGKAITTATVTSGTTASLEIASHGLVVGDFVFINEVPTVTGINFQTGYVTIVTDPNTVEVTFPNATLGAGPGAGGFCQYLTAMSDETKDCLRWYDGDPTNGSATTPVLQPPYGWVNFQPPLSLSSASIGDLPGAQYYLVGARLIIEFKDRLLFLGPVVKTSGSAADPIYLQDTILYSLNGTPYYTASFAYSTVNPTASVLSTATYHQLLVPDNQTSFVPAFMTDVTGFGGFIQLGYAEPIVSVRTNEDVLILGLASRQGRIIYTGNDLVPFTFYLINSEYGTESAFSAVNFDRGVISFGPRGIIITSQEQAVRIDLPIPDEIFQIDLTNFGPQRISAERDFINEWIYFSFQSNERGSTNFPNQTLIYNYRDETWAIFYESYTSYGIIRKSTGNTWATIGSIFSTWEEWNEPWNSGSTTLLQPTVMAGNQQGYVLVRDEGTGEGNSLFIQGVSSGVITSPDHGLETGDFIVISGALGTVGDEVNNNIFSVTTLTEDTFRLNPPISSGTTYLGNGSIKRMYKPFIQTKQFPMAWGLSRKTRLGPQQYLLTRTAQGQVTLVIYLSENTSSPFSDSGAYNLGPIVPGNDVDNSSLIYSTVLYTCPESTNLGLTSPNINLQQVTGSQQQQIWHRVNTSLIGDTVQLCITLSDEQMRDTNFYNQFVEIELHGFIMDINPSILLA